jgi:uncharacterized membrane protein YhaH (DUF805 family)
MFILFNYLFLIAIVLIALMIGVLAYEENAVSYESYEDVFWYYLFGANTYNENIFFNVDVFLIVLGILGGLYMLAVFIPSLAVTVRRLHDSGNSGWFILFELIPYVGGIVLFVFTLLDSQSGSNKWGPNPKNSDDYVDYHQPGYANNDYRGVEPSFATAMRNKNLHPCLKYSFAGITGNYGIEKFGTNIGRYHDNDLVLLNDSVSRKHAKITFNGSDFEIQDLGSSNKVIVNGQFVQSARLSNGDIIGLGEALLNFYS